MMSETTVTITHGGSRYYVAMCGVTSATFRQLGEAFSDATNKLFMERSALSKVPFTHLSELGRTRLEELYRVLGKE